MKIACLGDSITNYGGDALTYVNFLGKESFPLEGQNVGLSGSALGIPKGVGANPALSERYVQIEKDADIILVYGGSNDWGQTQFPCELGVVESTDTDRSTFCGALRFLLTTLRKEYPKALVVFATPMHRNDFVWYPKIGKKTEDVFEFNRFGYSLLDYRAAAMKICEKYDCPVMDTYLHPILNPWNMDSCNKYYRDGVHLNDEGAALLGAWFTDNLEKIWNSRK